MGKPAYVIKQQKSSFDFPAKDFCGGMNTYWDDIYGKDIYPTCKITVLKDGKRDYNCREFACAKLRKPVVCKERNGELFLEFYE